MRLRHKLFVVIAFLMLCANSVNSATAQTECPIDSSRLGVVLMRDQGAMEKLVNGIADRLRSQRVRVTILVSPRPPQPVPEIRRLIEAGASRIIVGTQDVGSRQQSLAFAHYLETDLEQGELWRVAILAADASQEDASSYAESIITVGNTCP